MRLSETLSLIPMVEPKDYGSAGILSQSVNLGKLNSITCYITFGAITGNTTLIVYASAATALTTTAMAFNYRLSAATYKTALSDQYGDKIAVASTGLLLTAATFKDKTIVVEVDADTMPDTTAAVPIHQPWLSLNFDSVATVLLLGVVGLGSPRYPGHLIPSVIA